MSIDKTISDLLAGMADVAAALRENAEATNKNTAITERVVEFQQKAIKANEAGKAPRKPRATAAEKTMAAAEEAGLVPPSTSTPAAGEAPVTDTVHPLLANPNSETAPVVNPKTNVTENTPTANYRASDFSLQQVKNEFIGWLGDTTNPEERKRRNAFVGAIAQHFGVGKPFAPDGGLSDAEQFKQALFYLRREREGLQVDFANDYDFDADPLADQTPAAVEESEEDALG